jgi:hypothetical protein
VTALRCGHPSSVNLNEVVDEQEVSGWIMVEMEGSYWAEGVDMALGGKNREYGPWASWSV